MTTKPTDISSAQFEHLKEAVEDNFRALCDRIDAQTHATIELYQQAEKTTDKALKAAIEAQATQAHHVGAALKSIMLARFGIAAELWLGEV